MPIARAAVDRERALAARPDPPPPLVGERRPVAGRYLPEAVLGVGGDGVALRARAGWDWPPTLVRVLDAVRPDGADQLVACAVREYADGTLADLLRARGGAVLPRGEALRVFAACCQTGTHTPVERPTQIAGGAPGADGVGRA